MQNQDGDTTIPSYVSYFEKQSRAKYQKWGGQSERKLLQRTYLGRS